MSQYVNLAGKIKSARKSLRLTQQELATRLSEVLGRPISRGLIARWEGTSAGSRLDPSPEQLKALASLAQKPWEQFLWFVDDEIAAGRGVEYYPDGTRSADPAYSDDEVQAMYAEHQRDMERLDATPPDPWLQQMIDFQEWKRVSGVLETDALERKYARD